jgi:putative oxidoreductase
LILYFVELRYGLEDSTVKHAQTVARILLGLIYFVFGLNGFLNFIPPPAVMPEGATSFFMALMGTGYFLPLLKTTEVVCGALLLARVAVPLALVILAPITLNILFFHFFLTPGLENLIMPVAMVALHVYLGTSYWGRYRPLFTK